MAKGRLPIMHNTLAEVFPPGEYLREELDARGWTQEEFADIIGRSYKQVNELLGGKAALTAPMAAAIAAALGTSAELWLNLESTFRLSLAEPVSHDVARRGRLRTEFPVREMQKRGWIPKLEKPENIDQLERCVYDFFAIAESDERSPYASAAKRADYTTALTRTQEAIVLRVRQLASRLRPAPYSEEALRRCIEQLKDLRADAIRACVSPTHSATPLVEREALSHIQKRFIEPLQRALLHMGRARLRVAVLAAASERGACGQRQRRDHHHPNQPLHQSATHVLRS